MRRFLAGLIGGLWLAVVPAAHAAGAEPAAGAAAPAAHAVPKAAEFFGERALDGARLSPDGRFIAMIVRNGADHGVVVYDLSTGEAHRVSGASNADTDVDWVRWKGSGRLLIGASYVHIERWNGKPDEDIKSITWSRFVIAIDRDGANGVIMFRDDKRAAGSAVSKLVELMDPLDNDPDHILVQAPTALGDPAVWKADIHTGAAKVVELGNDETVGWQTDSAGQLVARFLARNHAIIIQGRAPGAKVWTEVAHVRASEFDKGLADFEFLGPSDAPGALYVAVKPKTAAEGAARTVRLYDFRTGTLGPPLWRPLAYDIVSIVRSSTSDQMAGVCYWVDTFTCELKDASQQAVLRGIAAYFHGERNVALVSFSGDGHTWLLSVSGPEQPDEYYLYDNVAHTMNDLGPTRPGLGPDNLGRMSRFLFRARDGTMVPGYLTLPPAPPGGPPAAPPPLVVLPHGGPEARDFYDYDEITQWLATRGYAVLQMNFRGSGGYGVGWAEAGYRQWNGRMQDDIDDGVAALLASGQADPRRVCAVGISYGGYAALMAGARHPELYRCVASWAGITDLGQFLRWQHGMSFTEPTRYAYWSRSIGNEDADRAALLAASPVGHADHYGPPVLLIHGTEDDIVAPEQSRLMEKALKGAGRDVQLLLVDKEGHPYWRQDHMVRALDTLDAFLKAHIGAGPAAPATAK